jgi:hypothetical protein|tara:strand:- start:1313 stop:1507 length:195 start_codon:yes stop_codon:yes gene_type:complete
MKLNTHQPEVKTMTRNPNPFDYSILSDEDIKERDEWLEDYIDSGEEAEDYQRDLDDYDRWAGIK